MKVKELLSDKSKWTKNTYAKDKSNQPVPPRSRNAVCWCLIGAILKCYRNETKRSEITLKISNKTGKLLSAFNDHKNTTFKTIKRLVNELDI